ncbi:galactose-specific lectin nattectin-like [Symphorus nematophorus]
MTSGLSIIGVNCAPAPCCPPGWTRYGSRCFLFQNRGVTMVKAESICQALGGNLASIHSSEENTFVRELIHEEARSYPPAWIGGHDGVKDGHWMWTDGTKFNYVTWAPTEPNNHGGDERCLVNNWGGPSWNDEKCHSHKPFVCAKTL